MREDETGDATGQVVVEDIGPAADGVLRRVLPRLEAGAEVQEVQRLGVVEDCWSVMP